MWVRAIDQYAKVYKIVEPKMMKLKEAETELNQVMAVLREKQQQLAEVEAYIKGKLFICYAIIYGRLQFYL